MVMMCRLMFPRVTKRWGADEVLFKTYVTSLKTYEFGPLPAGREPELCVVYNCITVLLLSCNVM